MCKQIQRKIKKRFYNVLLVSKILGTRTKCDLRSYMQKSQGDVLEACFERVPRDLTYADCVTAIDRMKELCKKCKGQR